MTTPFSDKPDFLLTAAERHTRDELARLREGREMRERIISELESALAEVTRERDELAGLLREVVASGFGAPIGVLKKARAALSALDSKAGG